MILFVFEGEKREPCILDALKQNFGITESVVCVYGTDIHALYKKLSENDWDLFATLKERSQSLEDYKSSDIGQVYLFFDYDPQNRRISLKNLNRNIAEMLAYFNEETEHGKLYINYPMVESILYTKKLPDNDFHKYVVLLSDCQNFKKIASGFSGYGNYDFLSGNEAKDNWDKLKIQHVKKACFICCGKWEYPLDKEMIAQTEIFEAQIKKYVQLQQEVAILNAFPLFIFEYFK